MDLSENENFHIRIMLDYIYKNVLYTTIEVITVNLYIITVFYT